MHLGLQKEYRDNNFLDNELTLKHLQHRTFVITDRRKSIR